MKVKGIAKQKLANAHILLRCGEPEHERMCSELKQVLLEKFNNVEEAYTTESIYGTDDFCVLATAKINPKNAEEFETALKNLQVNSRLSSKVKDARVDLEIVNS